MKDGPLFSARSDLAFVRRVVIFVVIAIVLAALWALSDILLLLFGSILVAVTLRVFAAPLARHLGINDGGALILAGALIIVFIAVAALVVGPALAYQMRDLFEFLPTALTQVAQELRLGSLADLLSVSGSASSLGALALGIFAWSTTMVGALASLMLVIFGGIYLAANPKMYRDGFIKLVPPSLHPHANAVLDDAGEALRRWIHGQLIAMVLVGTMTGIGLWLVGIPSAFALGLITGLAEFIPMIGPILAAVPVALVAGTQGWESLLWALAAVVIVQQIESNLITPMIVGRVVTVAPAIGLFAVIAMGVLFGPLGLLFGFPLAVVFDVGVRRLYVRDTLGERIEILGKPAKKSK